MRIALLLQQEWETAPRLARILLDAGHEPVVNPGWEELDGFDLGMVRANFWEPGLGDLLGKALNLTVHGTPLFNSYTALLCCADKAVSGRLLEAAGLSVPYTWLPWAGDVLPERQHGWVVKPRVGAHQRAVEVFDTRREAERYLDSCGSEQIVQERIVGRYWRVIATAERAVRTYTMPVDARGVTALPDGELRGVVDDADPALESVGVAAVRALGGTLMGVDVIEDRAGRYWTLEGNAGFGFNIGDAEVERAIVLEAQALAERPARPAPRLRRSS